MRHAICPLPPRTHRARLTAPPALRFRTLAGANPIVTVRSADDLRAKIREIPDFPKPGILFYDITTLLKESRGVQRGDRPHGRAVGGDQIDLVVGMESRGFIFAAPLAYKLGAGFVPVRKLGKLPADTIEVEYDLEYGTATLEMHPRRDHAGPARADRRRPAGDRRDRAGHDRARAAAGRRDRRASRSWSS